MPAGISPNRQGMAWHRIVRKSRYSATAFSPCTSHSTPLSAGGDTRSQIIESRSRTILRCTFSDTPRPISIPPFPRQSPTPPLHPPPPPPPHSFFIIIIIINHHHNHHRYQIYIMISPKYSLAPSPLPLLAFGLAYFTELFNLMLAMIAPGCSTGSLPLLYNASLTHTEWNP